MPDLVKERISENKAIKSKFLDLGNCGLKEIPAEVGDLQWLEGLSLASDWFERGGILIKHLSRNRGTENTLTDLGPLVNLCSLQELHLGGTGISDLSPLASLPSLHTLDISGTPVRDLTPLAQLPLLRLLDVSRTQIIDLGPLVNLSGLQELHLGGTGISDLSPLASLPSLHILDISGTPVRDLTPLAQLPLLRLLDVSKTHVTDLGPMISLVRRWCVAQESSNFLLNMGINVNGCTLSNPPPEIVGRGNIAILNYLEARIREGADHLYEAKMLIVGEGGAGKTSLLRRLFFPSQGLPTEGESTKGIEIHKHEFKLKNGRTFRLNVWDFGGQQIYHATHQFFLTQRSLYVLLDDTRKDYKSVSDEGFKYWLGLIEVFGGHSPTLIFQNEKSGRSKEIDFRGIKQHYDNVKELYAGNLELRDAADKLRDGIEFYAANLGHIGEELPAGWLKVRKEIEKLAEKQAYFSVERYFEVYGRHIEPDQTKALLLSRYFHDLGVFLHFQDDMLLKRTVILQNEWATEAVFRILDDEEVKNKRGRFNESDCTRLWKDSAYGSMHPELLALMKNFELCYELKDSEPATWLAPQLLPPTKPDAVGNWSTANDLVLQYKYEFLPKGIVNRLTVRLHRFVKDPEKAWVTGVLFERDKTATLVEILPSGSEIEMRARGPEHKALLSVIAADLDVLNESFKGLRDKVDKRIPCNCKSCAIEATPWFFSQRDLLRRKQHGVEKAQCGVSYIEVNVVELLDGIKVKEVPPWAAPRTVQIFLASSSELRQDRDEFEAYFRRENDQFIDQGLYLKIVRWEYFLDAISETRLQDEYNKAILDCDIFVSLFFTKTGTFTEEEFDVAFRAFKQNGKPRIFTFFKKASVDIDGLSESDLKSLRVFQGKLSNLGHFYTRYEDARDLKLQFRAQLEKLMKKGGTKTTASDRRRDRR